jgi:hypothetical protein
MHPLSTLALQPYRASRAFATPRKAKAAIGLSIAVELVRRKLAKPTKDNRFAVAMRSYGAPNDIERKA